MKNRNAFTLIELLAVIAIIGLLAGLLIPLVNNVRDKALEIKSASNLRQLATANLAYLADHGTFAPNADRYDRTHWHGRRNGGTFDGSGGYLSPYLDEGGVRMCPVLEDWLDDSEGASFDEGTGGYGYNATYIGGRPDRINYRYPRGTPRNEMKRWIEMGNIPGNVPNPSQTVMFTSTAIVRGGGIVETGNSVPYRHLSRSGLGQHATPTVHFRFNGRAAVAWADGHVTFEEPNNASNDHNVYGGDNDEFNLGWFGPTEWNGYWNPRYEQQVPY